MKKRSIYILISVLIIFSTTLSGILIALLNMPISWTICDDYEEYRECYKVNMKYKDYLEKNDKEYYTEIRRIENES